MAKMSLEFSGLQEMMNKLRDAGADSKKVTEDALRKTHEIVTKKAAAAATKSNLPAGGKYSTGSTASSLQTTPKISWKGTEASVPVGYNIKTGGLPSIFMMYGTPRYMKNQAMYDAFYSEQTEDEVANAQKEIFENYMREVFGE